MQTSNFYSEVHKLGGMSKLDWIPLTQSPNYYNIFVADNPGEAGRKLQEVLNCFTQYETRMVEQAVKSHSCPHWNGSDTDITFQSKWLFSLDRGHAGARSILAETKSGDIYPFESIRSASDTLKVDNSSLSTIINHANNYAFSKPLGDHVRFYEQGVTLIQEGAYRKADTIQEYPGIDYESLPKGKIVMFDSDLNMIDEFDGGADALTSLGFSKDSLHILTSYVNRKLLSVAIGGVVMKVLLARNPHGAATRKAVTVVNTMTGEQHPFKRIRKAINFLGFTKTQSSTDFKKKHITDGKPLSNDQGTFKVYLKTSINLSYFPNPHSGTIVS